MWTMKHVVFRRKLFDMVKPENRPICFEGAYAKTTQKDLTVTVINSYHMQGVSIGTMVCNALYIYIYQVLI